VTTVTTPVHEGEQLEAAVMQTMCDEEIHTLEAHAAEPMEIETKSDAVAPANERI
jgi:hypothetical protein